MRAIRFSAVSSASAMTHWNILCADKAASPFSLHHTHAHTHTHTLARTDRHTHRTYSWACFRTSGLRSVLWICSAAGLDVDFIVFFIFYFFEIPPPPPMWCVFRLKSGLTAESQTVEIQAEVSVLPGFMWCSAFFFRRRRRRGGGKRTKFIDKRLNFCAFSGADPPLPPPPPLMACPDALQSHKGA